MSIRRSLWRALVFCTLVALLTGTNVETAGAQAAPAQGGNQAAGGESRLAATALAISEAPTIDGLLNEPAWQQAPVMNGFTQAEPLEGQPASQDTERPHPLRQRRHLRRRGAARHEPVADRHDGYPS